MLCIPILHPVLILRDRKEQRNQLCACSRYSSTLHRHPCEQRPPARRTGRLLPPVSKCNSNGQHVGHSLWLSNDNHMPSSNRGWLCCPRALHRRGHLRSVVQRTLILTGISARINSDLLRRSVMLELAPIGEEQRKLDSWLSAGSRDEPVSSEDFSTRSPASLRYIGTSRCSTRPQMADRAGALSSGRHGTDLTAAYLPRLSDTMRRPLYSGRSGARNS